MAGTATAVKRTRWWVALGAGAALGLAACSSSGSSGTSSSAASGTAGSTASAGAGGGSAVVMRAGLLTSADVPAGFTAGKSSKTSTAKTLAKAGSIPACGPYVAEQRALTNLPVQYSKDFTEKGGATGNDNKLSNRVVAYASTSAAGAAYAVYASPSLGTCMQDLFNQLISQEVASLVKPGTPTPTVTATVATASVPPAGQATVAYQVHLSVALNGTKVTANFYIQAVRQGTYLVTYVMEEFQSLPTGTLATAVSGSMGRLEAAMKASGQG